MPGQQDTVHSYRPTLPITYQYHLKPGESFYKDRNFQELCKWSIIY